jgi:hypothetical protein
VASLAGIEHGAGELAQGWEAPDSVFIRSWPESEAFQVLNGEPAMTLVPNLAVAGVLTIIVSLALGAWAVCCVSRRRGGLVLIAMALVLLLVGGGFGPPLVATIAGLGARGERARPPGSFAAGLAGIWPWALAGGVAAYLGLFPGLVLLSHFTGFESWVLVLVLTASAFAGLVLALAGARASDYAHRADAADDR